MYINNTEENSVDVFTEIPFPCLFMDCVLDSNVVNIIFVLLRFFLFLYDSNFLEEISKQKKSNNQYK